MYRTSLQELEEWKDQYNRKPLIIRGARQTGKTWLVRKFGADYFENFVEINFDRYPEKAGLFSMNVKQSLQYISVDTNESIVPGQTLLFLDEIQNVPQLIPILRYFYEEIPELHVIATGSLLDFVLEDHEFSMPVGRVSYFYLGPMNFEEFLQANEEIGLLNLLKTSDVSEIPEPLHIKLLEYVKLYWIIGGMPAALQTYIATKDIRLVQQEHESILQTYQDDFAKYQRKVDTYLLRKIFQRIPSQLGKKVMYSQILRDETSKKIAQNLHLLSMARILHPVHHSGGNGVPLGSEINERDFKLLFLDIGLLSTIFKLHLHQVSNLDGLLFVNGGVMAEQFIGQHLLYRHGSNQKPELFYWRRQAKSSSSELDYLVEYQGKVLPIEVKAGKSGSLKSLHVFVSSKNTPIAIRFNTNQGIVEDSTASIGKKEPQPFCLLSLALYQVGQLERLYLDVKDSKNQTSLSHEQFVTKNVSERRSGNHFSSNESKPDKT